MQKRFVNSDSSLVWASELVFKLDRKHFDIYRPQRSCGKVMFSQACVKQEFCPRFGRGCVSQNAIGRKVSVWGSMPRDGGVC